MLHLACALCCCAAAAGAAPYDVPLLENISIDGDASDWGDRGFQVQVLPDENGQMLSPPDFQPAFRLGWDGEGLLALVEVADDAAAEEADASKLWEGDSVEVYLAVPGEAGQFIEAVISPGVSEGQGEKRQALYRFESKPPLKSWVVESASHRTAGGYRIELRLPWSTIKATAEAGSEFGFQLVANDRDASEARFQALWYPEAKTHESLDRMHTIRLGDAASPPVRAFASAACDDTARVRVKAIGLESLVDAEVSARLPEAEASARMRASNGRAVAAFYLPMPDAGAPELDVQVGDEPSQQIALPEAAAAKGRLLISQDVRFADYVFAGTEFPEVDFENPLLVERLIGPYHIETAFYDEGFNPVSTANTPGRYGAIVTAVPADGRPVKRFQTIFRQPDSFDRFNPWFVYPEVSVGLPEAVGIAPEVVADNHDSISRYVNRKLTHAMNNDPDAAVLFAGLFEMNATGQARTAADDAWALDRQWWVELKRSLYPTDRALDTEFVAPTKVSGPPAPVLRMGSAEEAGMQPGAAEAIDALLTQWSAHSSEAFAVAIARHGVVFLHKAYGQRNGQPMTVDTPSWMASITKFMSGTGLMLLVDQGLVGLDDPVSDYLPELRGIQVETPLTIRHLYTHTNGMALQVQPPGHYMDHWGDEMNDMEEIIASYYPYLEVGKSRGYNGVGYALAGKVIEMVTGEALPQYYKKHILDPLGMQHTRFLDASAQTFSTPMDMAVFGQMLLNRGAYGEWRFMSEETFEAMLPKRLRDVLGMEDDVEWGIGAVWTKEEGLGAHTFGHGAASAATLRIDPENDLVIVMTRNQAGEEFGEYHARFIKAILSSR